MYDFNLTRIDLYITIKLKQFYSIEIVLIKSRMFWRKHPITSDIMIITDLTNHVYWSLQIEW